MRADVVSAFAACAALLSGCGDGGGDDPSTTTESPSSMPACQSETPALGVLGLEGYYWPTQPGDVNDYRTYCTTKGTDSLEYECNNFDWEDGVPQFKVVMAVVNGAIWGKVQVGDWSDEIQAGMKEALQSLYDNPDVCAITGHAGFFSLYQSHAYDIVDAIVKANASVQRKPMILGTPTMLSALTRSASLDIPNWDMMKEDSDRVLVLTSNYPSLTRPAIETVLTAYVDGYTDLKENTSDWVTSNAANIYSLGWNMMPGYGISVVYGALFHNAYLTAQSLTAQLAEALANITALNQSVVAIVMESTEMAANSNSVRLAAKQKIPVWDISTLAKCMVAASYNYTSSNSNIAEQLLKMPEFKDCMMVWVDNVEKLETRFGAQADGKLKYYEDQNLTEEQLKKLQCTGGRVQGMKTPIGRLMEEFDTGSTVYTKVREGCLETEKYCLCDGCDTKCPGGGSCGGPTSPCGATGENSSSAECKNSINIDVSSFSIKKQCPPKSDTTNIPAASNIPSLESSDVLLA